MNEKSFEKEFAFRAKLAGMLYIKIPDPIMTNYRLRNMARRGISDEPLRPFDGILITPGNNYCLEFKYQYGKLKYHQKLNQDAINKINNSFYVIRMIKRKNDNIYKIIQNDKIILETKNIEEIINYFKKED